MKCSLGKNYARGYQIGAGVYSCIFSYPLHHSPNVQAEHTTFLISLTGDAHSL
ncbi:hypothetical protein TPADAL_0919a [Treponema pallidum subsp. pallidum DAL-1]|uniref:Uncharacterized protein n=2 Tax=Treponema pallidum TaxID=160 RepID=A0AAU8RR79_TREPL|nr:lipoprotein, putative [Treponema pallidum subsp. pallidum str. Chicago]AEZ58055.1 hypothetical protein TPESAMD_0919a [Treponema pallidum subsp. pertenue str. SamoaD]AEZ59124.1 hypothetical protein TPECDC2_0919a [Treponema pallidum subsp. pertenue str. CDC2]AEZ60192.1 hypothetical protein TPEGAU_0919a [Treponema pallidum subsp. pertenue str. Gauthier]AEZ61251.1 hypothetical protein TPADAL_0919a [Treponema pallidum subsp. pallidum DAL-1]AGK84575.1 hypothetical protein TPFB_0919a [Treponema pa